LHMLGRYSTTKLHSQPISWVPNNEYMHTYTHTHTHTHIHIYIFFFLTVPGSKLFLASLLLLNLIAPNWVVTGDSERTQDRQTDRKWDQVCWALRWRSHHCFLFFIIHLFTYALVWVTSLPCPSHYCFFISIILCLCFVSLLIFIL
jgi:hypothetical protein